METVNYQKEIKRCEKLGAKKFRKLVLLVEDLKFKTIKKLCPRYIYWYDKLCDRKRDKQLKEVSTPEKRKEIVDHYRRQKLIMRKEFHRGKNRNYHIDKNKPTEILHYLNWNKKVHKQGMIRNAIAIPALAIAAGLGIAPLVTIPFLITEIGSLFINFQCVNLQNYNIYRYKEREEETKKKEEIRINNNIERYSKAGAVVSRSMEKTDDIPSLTNIIDSIETKEELEQLRNLVRETLGSNQAAQEKKGAYTKNKGSEGNVTINNNTN